MILVTVGTHNHGFNRLVKAADQLAATIDERVVIQRGSSSYVPQHAEHFQWASGAEMTRLIEEARAIITHAAAGTSMMGLKRHKHLVLVPRLGRYGEHMDDHQLELAHGLRDRGQVIVVDEPTPDTLRTALDEVSNLHYEIEGSAHLIASVRTQIDQWQAERSTTKRKHR